MEILVNPVEVIVKQGNLKWIIICNILGVLLFGSWFITQYQGLWFEIDKAIFYTFNEQLTLSKTFMYFVAFVNLRAFEKEIGGNVVRPNIAGLMGAYGAALSATKYKTSSISTKEELKCFSYKSVFHLQMPFASTSVP